MNRLAQLGAGVEKVGNHKLPRSSPVSLQAEWTGSLACSRERNFPFPGDGQIRFNIR